MSETVWLDTTYQTTCREKRTTHIRTLHTSINLFKGAFSCMENVFVPEI